MKKIIFTMLLSLSVMALSSQNPAATKETKLRRMPNGEGNEGVMQVPEMIKINFEKSYPKNIVAWTVEDNKYIAEYKDTINIGHIVTYDKEGNQLSVQDELAQSAYPAPITEYITTHYTNKNFTVWSMKNANNTMLYYFTQKSETVWFDSEGHFKNKTKNTSI